MKLTRKKIFLSLGFLLLVASLLRAQDWPQLQHFKKDNQALPALAKGEKRVVFMGNSITIGWKNADPDYFEENNYINRGISGQTTPQMLLRFRQDVIDLKPHIVVILAGTNDIAGNTGPIQLDQITDNIISMAELAQANGIHVILCSVLPAFDYPWRPGLRPDVKIPKLNNQLQAYARNAGLTYVNYFEAMTDGKNGLRSQLGYDGVHPTAAGYAVMKPLLEQAIDSILANHK